MTVRHWNALVRQLNLAVERHDRAAYIMITTALRRVLAEGAPTDWGPGDRVDAVQAAPLPGWV